MIWLHLVHYIGFAFAQCANSTLLYLILKKADRLFGSYRILMFSFAMYSLVYSWIEVFSQPIYHMKGPVAMVAIDGPLKNGAWLVKDLPSLYTGSFALCISLLAAQFTYRYVAMCREEVLNCCGEDTRKLSFIAPMYWSCGEKGEKLWKISAFMAAAGCCSVILHAMHLAGFLLAQVTNSTLLFLILKKADKLFGSYRILMFSFALYSLIYAWIEIAAQPIFHIKGPAIMVAVDGPLKYETWFDFLSLYAGSFALCVSLLAAQFTYRYLTMCRDEVLSCYGEDTRKLSFISPMYWSVGENGEKIWNISGFLGAAGCCSVISVCSSTIVFCAFNIYRKIELAQHQMSQKNLDLNRQLFLTLSFQTLLPFLMMYIPIGLVIILPFFEVPLGKLANIAGISLAIYPALEPIAAIFCIKEFRRTVFRCTRRKVEASNQYSAPFTVHDTSCSVHQ
ncbi:unnamed protein product [Caenorhabditis brenneri]